MSLVAKAVEELLWHLDAEMETKGWDRPSEALMVWHEGVPGGGLIGVESLPAWRHTRSCAPDVVTALAWLTSAYRDLPEDLKLAAIPDNLYAVALVSEAWVVRSPVEPDVRVSEAPGRFEVRLTYLMPVSGDKPMLLQHERDGIAKMTEDGSDGPIPELLRSLALAMTS